MSLIKSAVAVLLVLALAGVSFIGGRKSVKIPHVYVFNPSAKAFVPLIVPDGTKIVVASPEGFEPGVAAQKSKDGKFILILPPSLMEDKPDEEPGPGTPQNQAHHQPEMSNGERLDRASL